MRCFKSKKINETQKYVFKAKNSDSLFFWNKSTTQTCAVKSLKSKQFWYFWQGSSPNHLLFWKVFIFWSKIYKLPSGKHSDLFTQRKYSGEKFMTACQSDPWSSLGSPTSRMRKAPQCCWVMGVREEVGQMAIFLQPMTSSLLSIAAFSPHQKQRQPLTIRRLLSLKVHASGKNHYRLFHVCLSHALFQRASNCSIK